jgi:hypothetical protein
MLYQRKNQAKLKEIFSLLQKDVQDQVKDADLLREAPELIDQDLPADIKHLKSFFSSCSLDPDYNLVIYLSLIPASTCYLRKSLVPKEFLSTSFPTPPLKKKTPC